MHALTAALSQASTAGDVAEVACRLGSEAMQASGGAMWIARPDETFSLVGSWGKCQGFLAELGLAPTQSRT
jgi:hypothetical protein